MNTTVVSVSPETSLASLEDTLVGRHITGVPVLEDGRLVGIVSRSDIVRYFTLQRSLAEAVGHSLSGGSGWGDGDPNLAVRDIMVTDLHVVAPDASIVEVAAQMAEYHVHRVIVTENDTVVGIVSSLDIARLLASGRVVPA